MLLPTLAAAAVRGWQSRIRVHRQAGQQRGIKLVVIASYAFSLFVWLAFATHVA